MRCPLLTRGTDWQRLGRTLRRPTLRISSRVVTVSTEVFSSGNCSAKQGFAIAKRLRNWSFARKFPVVEQPKCGAKNIPRIFRRGQTSSGLPPVDSSFGPSHWASLNFPAREESDKFIRATKTFICIFHFHAKSMQQSLLRSNRVERVVNSLHFPRGIFKCFQFMVLPSQALHHKEQSVSHVVTCYNPSGPPLHFVNWMLADSKVWYLTQQIRLETVNTWECGRDSQPRHRDSWPSRIVDNTTGMSLILTRYHILSIIFSWKIPLWSL